MAKKKARSRSKNPAVAWITKGGKRVIPCPTEKNANELLKFYRKEFPKDTWGIELSSAAMKNPALLVMSNPVDLTGPLPKGVAKAALDAYRKFHMVDPNKIQKGNVPAGWPKTYITIGWARRFDWVDNDGVEHSRRFTSGSVKLCTTAAMKDVFLFGSRLGVTSGTALRVDYDVPPHSGRNKWAKQWWHPHDSHPKVTGHPGGKAAKLHGPGLKVNKRGIIG